MLAVISMPLVTKYSHAKTLGLKSSLSPEFCTVSRIQMGLTVLGLGRVLESTLAILDVCV